MVELFTLPIDEVEGLTSEYCESHFPKRYERAKTFRQRADYLRCVAAGELLVRAKIPEEGIFLGPHGKPLAADKYFNLSHSGKYAVLAVSDSDVGVDIEEIDPKHLLVATKVFTPLELEWMGEDVNRFFVIWTLKEAVIKMFGDGISMPMESFSVLDLALSGFGVVNGVRVTSKTTEFDGHIISYVKKEQSV